MLVGTCIKEKFDNKKNHCKMYASQDPGQHIIYRGEFMWTHHFPLIATATWPLKAMPFPAPTHLLGSRPVLGGNLTTVDRRRWRGGKHNGNINSCEELRERHAIVDDGGRAVRRFGGEDVRGGKAGMGDDASTRGGDGMGSGP